MISLKHSLRRNVVRFLSALFLVSISSPALFGDGVTIRFAGDSDVGEQGRWIRALAEEWAKKTGNRLEYISRPNDASATLQQYQQYWAAKSSDVDVYLIDVIWPGIAAPHAVDLKKYFKEDEIKQHFPRIIRNNTVNGHLIALPAFADAGLLYYRTDLLEKYGYKEPPKLWKELSEMAKKIQDGEQRDGKPDFQGFVFEGNAYEGLTGNAIEWIYSYGGGSIIEPGTKKVTIDNPNAIKALETIRGFVGTISPTGVTTYTEEDARNIWQAGNAAFMRNWPYAYALSADSKSPVSGKFAVSVLPRGSESGKKAACLGGYQLMVSTYSKNADTSAELVRYLCSSEAQKRRAIDLGQFPTRPDLYTDADIMAKNPWFKDAIEVLNNAVARPSTITGVNYNQLSTVLFQNVNKVISGRESAKDAVQQIERTAKRVVH